MFSPSQIVPGQQRPADIEATALQHWPAAGAGLGAGATLSSLLSAFVSQGPIQAPIDPCLPCSASEDNRAGFADDLQRLSSAVQLLPLDYILCVLIGLFITLLIDLYHIGKVLVRQIGQIRVVPSQEHHHRPDFLPIDVTRGR